MKIKYLILLLIFLCSQWAFGQKNAPVAGDAATLIDLLKKDYNSLSIEERAEAIIKDRATVISYFKSYLDDKEKATFATLVAKGNTLSIKTSSREYISSKLIANGLDAKDAEKRSALDSLSKAQLRFYDTRNSMDSMELRSLESVYSASSNIYLKTVIYSFYEKYEALKKGASDPFSAVNHTSSLQKSIPFLGGDELFKMAIEGLSQFIANRVKEELTTSVLRGFQDWLEKNDSLEIIKTILPQTYNYLVNFSPEKINGFPQEIRQYIEIDLNHLLTNIDKIQQVAEFEKLVKQSHEVAFAFEALKMIQDIAKAKYPIDYFKILENSKLINEWKTENSTRGNMANTLLLSSMVAHSMQVMDNGEPRLAGTDFLWSYLQELNFCYLYTGFLYQQNKKYYNISINGKAVSTALAAIVKDTTAQKVNNYKKKMEQLLNGISINAEKVWVAGMEIRKAKKAGLNVGADTIYNFIGGMIDFTQNTVYQLSEFSAIIDVKIPGKDLDLYFKTAKTTNEIFYDLQSKRYTAGLSRTLELVASYIPETTLGNSRKSNIFKELIKQEKVIALFRFINDMASAKDENDIEQAIEALVLPAGSYATKRAASFNVSLNTFPGILIAQEWAAEQGEAFAPSLTVPVGLSIATSGRYGSFGVFIPVIDIGAVTRLRFDSKDSANALPELNFKNIFAPGIFLSYGISKLPITINGGIQYGPELKVKEQGVDPKYYESYRIGLGIVVDIPLLTIYNKPSF